MPRPTRGAPYEVRKFGAEISSAVGQLGFLYRRLRKLSDESAELVPVVRDLVSGLDKLNLIAGAGHSSPTTPSSKRTLLLEPCLPLQSVRRARINEFADYVDERVFPQRKPESLNVTFIELDADSLVFDVEPIDILDSSVCPPPSYGRVEACPTQPLRVDTEESCPSWPETVEATLDDRDSKPKPMRVDSEESSGSQIDSDDDTPLSYCNICGVPLDVSAERCPGCAVPNLLDATSAIPSSSSQLATLLDEYLASAGLDVACAGDMSETQLYASILEVDRFTELVAALSLPIAEHGQVVPECELLRLATLFGVATEDCGFKCFFDEFYEDLKAGVMEDLAGFLSMAGRIPSRRAGGIRLCARWIAFPETRRLRTATLEQ